MRILYLITRAEHGGAQAHLLQLATEAARRGEVLVAMGEDGQLRETLLDLGIENVVLKHLRHAPHVWHDPAGVMEISRLVRHFRPDLLHAHSSKAGTLGRLAAALHSVPSIYTAHGFAFAKGTRPARKIVALAGEWLAGRLGDFTIAVSQSECRMGRHFGVIRNGKSAFIYNGVPETDLRAHPEDNPPVIVMAARFAYPKQQRLLIRAFSRTHGDARLWFIGEGPGLPAAQAEAAHCRRESAITFWGDRNDVTGLLAKSQIGVLVSEHEGFGLSLIEAMSVGLPVIASRCGGMREIVQPGKNGLLVPPHDELALTNALHELIANPLRRREMGACGLVDFRSRFTARAMIAQTFKVYESLFDAEPHVVSGQCSATSCVHCGRNFAVAGD